MIETLALHRQELEKELRERVQAFFESNNEAPESVSIEMKLSETDHDNHIHVLVKESATNT